MQSVKYTEDTAPDGIKPAIVSLHYKKYSCTAFHIGNGHFITAAHCLGEDVSWPEDAIKLVDTNDQTHFAKIIMIDLRRDMMLLVTHDFTGPALEIWNPLSDGKPSRGMKLMSAGFPSYYFTEYTFDFGYLKDMAYHHGDNLQTILSKDISFRGDSGGPVISLRNGKVIGMTDAVLERIDRFDEKDQTHQHASLSILIGYSEISALIKENR